MAQVTDETLMFYADGVLASPEREHVARLLERDSELRSRLQVFERTGGELAELLRDHVEAPVPDRLYESLRQSEHKQLSFADGYQMLRQLPKFAIEKLRAVEILNLRVAAAVVGLIAGVVLGWGLRGDMGGSAIALNDLIQLRGQTLIAQGQLQRTLESAPSSKTSGSVASSKNDQLEISPRITFRNAAGNYCRQYEIAGPAINRYVGVACRSEHEWRVEMQAITPPANSGPDRFVPATGDASVAMDAAIGALVFGSPLTGEEEATVIRESWKNASGN